VQDANQTKVYTDGAENETANQTINLQDSDGFDIGKWRNSNFNGLIDNVRVYNCAFSPNQ